MGPISGLVVAPVIGVLSDKCALSFGRRRPFIVGGVIFCVLGMTLFANAARLTGGNLFTARLLAIIAFGILDFATNAIMFPSRALLGDLLPPEQQHSAQSAAAVIASIAEICSGAYIYSWKDPVTHIGRIFAVASVLLVLSCTVSVVVCVERPLHYILTTALDTEAPMSLTSGPPSPNEKSSCQPIRTNVVNRNDEDEQLHLNSPESINSDRTFAKSVANDTDDGTQSVTVETTIDVEHEPFSLYAELIETVRTALTNFPRALIPVGVVYGLAWFVWFSTLPFYSQWLGVDVLHGNPQAAAGSAAALAYERGVSVFSIANMVKASLALVFAAFYPTIILWVGSIGERVVFSLAFLTFSGFLFACAETHNVLVAATVIALGSVPFIATQTIPIAIVVQRYPDNLASNLGVMYVFFLQVNIYVYFPLLVHISGFARLCFSFV